MNIYAHVEDEIRRVITALAAEGKGIPKGLDLSQVSCESPRDPKHGDLATNAAMVLAKPVGSPPRALAQYIAEKLKDIDGISHVEIAGPGFINMRLHPAEWQMRVDDILAAGTAWGDSGIGAGQMVNVEYVSANPTGPLHAAHARGAIIGDALAALLEKTGYRVTREYYINDAGSQVDTLARSAYLRYREALGEDIGTIPEGYYPGIYLKDTGQKLAAAHGDRFLNKDEEEWLPIIRAFAIDDMMASIKHDLIRLGINIDIFSSERALVEGGAVEKTITNLEQKGLIYQGTLKPPKGKKPDDWESREQTLFKATEFGDDIDRPIKKSDGTWTYFASDVAYHLDKLSRGSERLIDIWGADHGGYVKRMVAATTALSGRKDALDVRLCQLVNLMDKGKPVKMSKRAGTFVTLSDVLDSVGKDILRFIMLTRRSDQAMDFDYAKVTEQSRDNPVFYVNYAHARAMSVLRSGSGKYNAGADLTLLTDDAEINLIKIMASYPRQVEAAAEAYEPHRIAFYLNDLAAAFHALWNKGRDNPRLKFIIEDDDDITAARLRMVDALALVIRNGLAMLGVDAVEEM
jgi:arginyl-tRNA synthetase